MTFKQYIAKYPNAEIDFDPLTEQEKDWAVKVASAFEGDEEDVSLLCFAGSFDYNVDNLEKWFKEKKGWKFGSKAIEEFNIKKALQGASLKFYEKNGKYYLASGDANHRIVMAAIKLNFLLRSKYEEFGTITKRELSGLLSKYSVKAKVVHAEVDKDVVDTINWTIGKLFECMTKSEKDFNLYDPKGDERAGLHAHYDRLEKKYKIEYDGKTFESSNEQAVVNFIDDVSDQKGGLKDDN